MMKKITALLCMLMLSVSLVTGCGSQSGDTSDNSKADSAGQGEGAQEDGAQEDSALEDGMYSAEFDTDSSMFHVSEACDGKGTLTVENGEMTIHISLASKKIVNLFPGLAEDAQKDGAKILEPTTDTEGGSGKATVSSPAVLVVKDGKAYARIEWSSPNYDYMKVGGEKYDPVNTEGNSVFEIPVTVFDEKMDVIADTTAMSTPHEIEYTLTFHMDE